jgi:hypothetical protein
MRGDAPGAGCAASSDSPATSAERAIAPATVLATKRDFNFRVLRDIQFLRANHSPGVKRPGRSCGRHVMRKRLNND